MMIVRDLFLFQIETMLRVSDLFALKPINIDTANRELRIWQEKTRKNVRIPLSNATMEILEKYNFALPVVDKRLYNIRLKELGQLSRIAEQTEVVKFIGNKRIVSVVPKYQLISSHTARRTGITLLLLAGIQPEIISKISGHSDIRTLMKYIKIDQEHAIETVRSVWERE